MPNNISNPRRIKKAQNRENKITMKMPSLKSLLPFLITLLVPFRKALRTLVRKRLTPVIRHGLNTIATVLVTKEVITAEMADRIVELHDLILAILLGLLALFWAWLEASWLAKTDPKDLESDTDKNLKHLVPALILFIGVLSLASCNRPLVEQVGNRAKALGLGVYGTLSGEGLCLCVDKSRKTDEEKTLEETNNGTLDADFEILPEK